MENFVHATFETQRDATHAVEHLVDAGFRPEQISALLQKNGSVEKIEVKHRTGVLIGALTGALIGIGLGAISLPGAGLLSVGPWFGAFGAALVGGALGVLIGTLGGLGYWKEGIDIPAASFHSGTVVVGVTTNQERTDQARAALESAGAHESRVTVTH